MLNPTISRELQRERQTQLLREAEADRLASAASAASASEPAQGLDQRVMLPVADALVALGQRIQRHYAEGESAGAPGYALATGTPSPISAEDWLAFLTRNVHPGGTYLMIHLNEQGAAGFTWWGTLSASSSLGLSASGLRTGNS